MPESSLVPERQLVFSPGLAATIGLEEAILLQHLADCLARDPGAERDGYAWLDVPRQYLLDSLPFFSVEDLQRVSRSLADKGVILVASAPLARSETLTFALNEPVRTAQTQQTSTAPASVGRSQYGQPSRRCSTVSTSSAQKIARIISTATRPQTNPIMKKAGSSR